MREYLEKRLETLIGEHTNGQNAVKNLEAQIAQVRETMLRIGGAITVVQEALRDGPKEAQVPLSAVSLPGAGKAQLQSVIDYAATPDPREPTGTGCDTSEGGTR